MHTLSRTHTHTLSYTHTHLLCWARSWCWRQRCTQYINIHTLSHAYTHTTTHTKLHTHTHRFVVLGTQLALTSALIRAGVGSPLFDPITALQVCVILQRTATRCNILHPFWSCCSIASLCECVCVCVYFWTLHETYTLMHSWIIHEGVDVCV